jgi:hypothetical protein
VLVSSSTVINGGTSSAMAVGMSVHVTGYRRGDGVILATRVRVGKSRHSASLGRRSRCCRHVVDKEGALDGPVHYGDRTSPVDVAGLAGSRHTLPRSTFASQEFEHVDLCPFGDPDSAVVLPHSRLRSLSLPCPLPSGSWPGCLSNTEPADARPIQAALQFRIDGLPARRRENRFHGNMWRASATRLFHGWSPECRDASGELGTLTPGLVNRAMRL